MIKTLDSTYSKAYLEQVAANATQLNDEEINQLIGILNCFEDLFDVTLGEWGTEPIDLELNPGSKPLNCKYYPASRINKETFRK